MNEENRRKGLTSAEAKERLSRSGFNELMMPQRGRPVALMLAQFKSPLIYILFFAGLTTLFLREWTDAVVIFTAVGLNTLLGFFQEYRAEKALLALKKILVSHAKVIRDGREVKVELRYLVPGDVVVLGAGDKVPADGRLLEAVELFHDEAVLTGESVPVAKKEGDGVFMGTIVASGRGLFQIEHTGLETKVGKISAKMEETVAEETPLKKQIGHFSRVLATIFSVICVLILLEGLWRGRPFVEMFTLSVSIAVASIPEGLAVSLTVVMTLGMQRILKRKGLVRRLLAAETLGAVDVICADKTGTLTEGRMRVVEGLTDAAKFKTDDLARAAVLCNNLQNPIEVAMLAWGQETLADADDLVAQTARVDEIPFTSDRKFIAVLVETDKGQGKLYFSGAPEVVLESASLSKAARKDWYTKLDETTQKGLRVVAFSQLSGSMAVLKKELSKLHRLKDARAVMRAGNQGLSWLGLVVFEDPVRAEVAESLRLCREAGIRVKVITGDYRQTAVAVLQKLSLLEAKPKASEVLEGWELAKLTDDQLSERIEKVVLFVRTTPEQKIRLVEALQKKGHSVAMMGDGVNDALALKKADIGVVVGDASEVAKETADMVLLDSNFRTIVAAVEEGRGIFENIRKVILYLLSDSFTEVILIGGSLLLGLPTPLLPAQILWVNLVEDGLPGLALAFEPKDEGLMNDLPRSRKTPVLDQEMKIIIFMIGLITDLLLFLTYWVLLRRGVASETIRSVIFAGLAIDSLFYVFPCKTLRKNLWQENFLNNRFLLVSLGLGILLLMVGLYLPALNILLKTAPLAWEWWILILSLGVLNLIGIELVKWIFLHPSLGVLSRLEKRKTRV